MSSVAAQQLIVFPSTRNPTRGLRSLEVRLQVTDQPRLADLSDAKELCLQPCTCSYQTFFYGTIASEEDSSPNELAVRDEF
jgi:hypothetical protein